MTNIVQTEDTCGGDPRIDGTRVSVPVIYGMWDGPAWNGGGDGITPDKIAERMPPQVDEQDVRAAIIYALSNDIEANRPVV